MFRTALSLVVFLAGLLAACWIGIGYIGSNAIGAAVALVIAACYVAGAVELLHYRRATAALTRALDQVALAGTDLSAWLQQVPGALRNAVRLRVDGERIALPGPVLTPYLVGLLVLLGMLGTLLGMMATLRGTGLALESATDLQAIRGSLGAPVEGLAVAFGTSIAGVATSAMLGLLSALCRRERLQVVQQLDAAIATDLHVHSQSWQRTEAFRLLQAQAGLMPALVERLQAMTNAIEQHSSDTQQRLLESQQVFHAKADAEHARLAASVEQALKDSASESARAVGSALQPVMETTLAAISRETTALQGSVSEAVQRQLQGLETGFAASRSATTETWNAALASQRESHAALGEMLRGTLTEVVQQHDQQGRGLADALGSRFDASMQRALEAQQTQQQDNARLTDDLRAALAGFAQQHGQQSGDLLAAVSTRLDASAERSTQAQNALIEAVAARLETTSTHWAAAQQAQQQALQQFGERHDQRATDLLEALGARMAHSTDAAADAWSQALSRQTALNDGLTERSRQAWAAATAGFDAQAQQLVAAMQQSQDALQDALEARDTQRLALWSDSFTALTTTLGQQMTRTGAEVSERQQQICDALARTAQEISAQTQAHASDTIAEIARLVQVASEAPKAAADVVAELRQKLSDSMVRDTAMLDERSRLLATLETLLDAVNHASTEQRTAVDALVTTSADLLERVGTRFTDHLAAETGKLGDVAAQVTGSAVEVASLADAFGSAMQQFGSASTGLGERLETVATALDASLSRSDEQLAYYVAQAREVVDLSVLSQQQIIEELQQLAGRRRAAGTAKA